MNIPKEICFYFTRFWTHNQVICYLIVNGFAGMWFLLNIFLKDLDGVTKLAQIFYLGREGLGLHWVYLVVVKHLKTLVT